MMRALVLNDEITQKIKTQVAWANDPANWYQPEKDAEPPGDNPAYVMMLEVGYRVVYTMTVAKGQRFRHLSISVDGPKFPSPEAAFTIATLFGFTRGIEENGVTMKIGKDWMMQMGVDGRSVVIAQRIEGNP